MYSGVCTICRLLRCESVVKWGRSGSYRIQLEGSKSRGLSSLTRLCMTPLLHMHFSCHGLKLPMCFCHENILQEFEHTQALRLRSRTFNMCPLCNIFLHRVTFHVLADEFLPRNWNRGALGLSWSSQTSSKTDYGTRNELRIPFPLLEIHFTEKKPTRTSY